jgi:hypothetical protein
MAKTDKIAMLVARVLASTETDFATLAKLAELDPTEDFRFANLAGADFSGMSLDGFDFTGADMSGCIFRGARISGARFDNAKLDAGALADAVDWHEHGKSDEQQFSVSDRMLAPLNQRSASIVGKMKARRLRCYVVMPFGKKIVGDIEIDFDLIYDKYIKAAGEEAKYETRRADTDETGGLIVPKMMSAIYKSDLVVAEVSYYNPNVYYELGIRHALCRHGTVLIRRESGNLGIRKLRGWGAPRSATVPTAFNISGLTIWPYDFSSSALKGEIKRLSDRMLAAAQATDTDSPVFQNLPNLRVTTGARPASRWDDRTYEIVGAPGKFIGYRSGDIANLTGSEAVDLWVNSENALMQMARMYERSVSSTIRYHGALNPDPKSPGFQDTIADALKAALGNRSSVEPGEVLVTTSGRLAETHGVKAILHAATVIGSPGRGFHPIPDHQLADTVGQVIATARRLIRKGDPALVGKSLIMPLFGTGQARRDPAVIAGQLIEAAIQSLCHDPEARPGDPDLKLVLFSAFSEDDVALLRRLFDSFVADNELKHATKGDAA